MQDINVFITRGSSGTVISLDQPIAGAHSGDDVSWRFHSADPNVNWVEVEFQDQNCRFFKRRTGERKHCRYAALTGGHGELTGVAPPLQMSPSSAQYKYSVRAFSDPYDPNDPKQPYPPRQMVAELDPDIIVCDP